MSVLGRLERRWLGLPPARSALLETDTWMTATDGTRLATRVLRPVDASCRRGTVLIRSERPLRGAGALEKLARWLAQDGRTVLLQSCRGRGGSEGVFRPFLDEVADGRDALRWATSGPGCDDAVVLVGLGYSAFSAWAAAVGDGERVAGLATGYGARDPHAWLYPGGALQLEVALALAARLDGRCGFGPSRLDLARAGRHRLLGECDRVALRELSAFREWIAHPERDAWWEARTPGLPDPEPPILFLNGFYEGSLHAAHADYRALARRAAARGTAPPSLVLGPWGAAPLPREERARRAGPLAGIARAVLEFTAQVVGARRGRERIARVYARGSGWRETASWPPSSTTRRTLHLRGDGPANSGHGAGRLAVELPGAESADSFTADPADPVPSRGGVAVGRDAGPVDQSQVARRGDVLCFTGEPLPAPLELAGEASLQLHVGETAEGDLTCAKLVALEPDGAARWLSEGAVRGPRDGGALSIDLGPTAAYLPAGARLRIEVAASSLPRFAGPELDDASPRRRVVYHDARRPSALHFEALS